MNLSDRVEATLLPIDRWSVPIYAIIHLIKPLPLLLVRPSNHFMFLRGFWHCVLVPVIGHQLKDLLANFSFRAATNTTISH